jgi:hypothetical protein
MRKLCQIFTGLFILILSVSASAQSKLGSDYFEGKWDVLVKGLPNGDTKLFVVLEKKDSTMTGSIQDSTGKLVAKIDRVQLTDSTATVYFNAENYDVTFLLTKKDEDHITGSMMNMFEAEGTRVKIIKE